MWRRLSLPLCSPKWFHGSAFHSAPLSNGSASLIENTTVDSEASPDSDEENSKKLVLTDRSGDIFLIGLNRPEKRNCINEETATQLLQAVAEFEKDPSAKVGVLYGKGGTFCAGYDLTALAGRDEEWIENMSEFSGPMGPSRNFLSKPLIAAVNGYAVAGGLELALLCDLRVVEEDAIFGVYCRRYGIPLLDGGTVRLPALIGFSRAMDMILTGRPVAAPEALQMGLANRVVARGSAIGQAIQLASIIAKFPQECMLTDRRSAYYATYNAKSYEDALVHEHLSGKRVIMKEGIKGAQGFVGGLGRHGKFNFNAQTLHSLEKSQDSK